MAHHRPTPLSTSLSAHRRARLATLAALAATALTACGGSDNADNGSEPPPAALRADIRRTQMGVAHIKASDWRGLGYGFGYAQAQDNLCTLADAFLTYRGERSRYLGGQALARHLGTIGQPANLDSDFFHRHVLDDEAVQAMVAAQSDDLRALVAGFAAGYNRYVREIKGGAESKAHAACRSQPWLLPIAEADVWRRMMQANLAAGYSNFVSAIANAQPPAAKAGPDAAPPRIDGPLRPPPLQVGGAAGVGSNMYGFGRTATGGASVLFGNPHWYWKGADRFYQAQLTIPGQIDVSGVSFLGVPLVLIGFNEHVAWSHTVSTARRFGLFQLQLDASDPTRYLVDGRAVPMQATTIEVQDLLPTGDVQTRTRTLYKSSHGPIAHLGAMHPALGWTAASAFAIRDINAGNHRSFRNWLRWAQARSLDEFIRIQKEEAAVPWVNTVAVGRGSGLAWYADMGAVPNAPPALLATCATPVSEALAQALPGVPVLDGSRSACQWQSDADSAQPGAIGPARMPSLRHDDYVANMNDSHWLANPERPLTGFDPIFGPTGVAQSLRTRLGHQMVRDRFDGADGLPDWRASADAVRQIVLGSRVYSAELFKADLLALACGSPAASLRPACDTLRLWDNRGHADSRGSHLWDEFWRRLPAPDSDDDKKLFAVPFSARDPLHTPRGFAAKAADTLRATLQAAAEAVTRSGAALDAERGSLLYATRGGETIALYGGCGEHGYFTIACSEKPLGQGGYSMDGQPHGNTYLQVVSFTRTGVQAHTLLAHAQSDDPASAHHGDYTRAYAKRQWLRLPFTESEITASPGYRRISLRE